MPGREVRVLQAESLEVVPFMGQSAQGLGVHPIRDKVTSPSPGKSSWSGNIFGMILQNKAMPAVRRAWQGCHTDTPSRQRV